MKAKSLIIAASIFATATTTIAAVKTQTFDSSWTIAPWNYYGDISAMQWHYIPYETWDSTLGTLTGVKVQTTISGTKANAADVTAIRYSFFTGWNPADYQFYDQLIIPSGSTIFSAERTYSFSGPGLSNWLTYDYLPQANYYLESKTITGGHTILASTTLSYEYTPAVPEPDAFVLALAGALIAAASVRLRATNALHVAKKPSN